MKRLGLLALIFFVIVGSDQWTKSWAIDALKGFPTQQYLGGWLLLLYAENTGAWGSMGSGLSDTWRFWILTVLPFIFLGGLTWYTVFSKELKPYMVFSYGLVIAGGLGNLIDRAAHGFVVDFLWVGIPDVIGTNIFNIADVAIMLGVIVLVIAHFTIERRQQAG
jgi:signal peptidase II